MQEFTTFFVVQLLYYLLIVVNMRATAAGNYGVLAGSDFLVATVSFFVVKRIASREHGLIAWAGYASGSVCGSLVGLWLARQLGQ